MSTEVERVEERLTRRVIERLQEERPYQAPEQVLPSRQVRALIHVLAEELVALETPK